MGEPGSGMGGPSEVGGCPLELLGLAVVVGTGDGARAGTRTLPQHHFFLNGIRNIAKKRLESIPGGERLLYF